MKNGRTRLFVIIDPTAEHQIGLVKALLLAKLAECEIHAFMCVHGNTEGGGDSVSHGDSKHASLLDADSRLQQWLEPCRIAGVPVSKEVAWSREWYDAALQAIARSDCDLVIKSSFHHGKLRRFFSPSSDYALMRNCSRPILFTHDEQEWRSNRLLACVDLESTDPQHTRLNDAVIRAARALADIVGMDLYIASAYQDAIDAERLPLEGNGREVDPELLAPYFKVDASRILLRQGAAVESLDAICSQAEPSIVVMGTLARSGISGKLIGNTAEKLLDRIDADLLTVS